MQLTIEIVTAAEPGPPAGAPVLVQVRDAGLADTESVILSEARARSRGARAGDAIARVQIEARADAAHAIVFVHVDVDGDGAISKGDFITMQSYPVRDGGTMRVEVRRV